MPIHDPSTITSTVGIGSHLRLAAVVVVVALAAPFAALRDKTGV